MADRSGIEWTDATWNPIRARNLATGKVGWHCVHASEGCRNCYAETLNLRLGTGLEFKPQLLGLETEVFLDEKMLTQPLRWARPRRIFVGSMTDIFADFVTDAMLDRVFAAMALCPHHTFQVLTKRAARMREYVTAFVDGQRHVFGEARRFDPDCRLDDILPDGKPLPNAWLGTSAEDQPSADERIRHLLATPAVVRFLSAEPLLGPISFRWAKWDDWKDADGKDRPKVDHLDGARRLDLVIAGGESGPRARPMHPDWARQLRDQCAAAGVAFFFKQWGSHRWAERIEGDPATLTAYRCPKHADGYDRLDGQEHKAMPRQALARAA